MCHLHTSDLAEVQVRGGGVNSGRMPNAAFLHWKLCLAWAWNIKASVYSQGLYDKSQLTPDNRAGTWNSASPCIFSWLELFYKFTRGSRADSELCGSLEFGTGLPDLTMAQPQLVWTTKIPVFKSNWFSPLSMLPSKQTGKWGRDTERGQWERVYPWAAKTTVAGREDAGADGFLRSLLPAC